MKILGLDFDNTLVNYDSLFHKTALEKGLIKETVPEEKKAIRDYIRNNGKDEQFTLLQGEVYGLRILEAEPSEGVLEALRKIQKRKITMVLVSHKTRTPYKGPQYDLHLGATKWLTKHGFFDPKGLNWKDSQVYFEESKEKKIARIKELGCTHYIDDLEEILKMLPPRIKRIKYGKKITQDVGMNIKSLNNWADLYKYI